MNRKILVTAAFMLMFITVMAGNKVFVIESYHKEFAWDASFEKGILNELGGKYSIDFFYMDTKRLPKSEHQGMADKAWDKYKQINPDVVLLADDAALKFLGPKFAETKTPVVFLGINNNPRNYFNKFLPDNINGILERPLLKRSIAYIHDILPKVKKLLILFDSDLTSQIVRAEIFDNKNTITITDIDAEIKNIATYKEWQEEIKAVKGKYDAVVVGLYQTLKDEKGNVVDPETVVKWTSANIAVPPFAFWDFAVADDKTIGGLVLFGQEQGEAAAQMIKKILSGTPLNKIATVTADNGELLFSKKQLEKYKIVLPEAVRKNARIID